MALSMNKRTDIEEWLAAQGCGHTRVGGTITIILPEGERVITTGGTENELDNWLVGFYLGWKAAKGEL